VLHQAEHSLLILEKSRGVGGRVATRRIAAATLDFGAQFMTARDSRFKAAVDYWVDRGVLTEWDWSTRERPDRHPRWRGSPAMTAVPKLLAGDLDVSRQRQVTALRREKHAWNALLQDGTSVRAAAVVLTPPVPQSLALLDAGGYELDEDVRGRLESLTYEPCFAVLAVLDGPSRIPRPGAVALTEGPISWIADNRIKGVSAAEHWTGRDVITFQVHGWRYSKPIRIDASPSVVICDSPPLVMAGDAFGGGRIEGAVISGWSAVDRLSSLI
jgi:predicted NAD/FAD-dependent oxidoreductase